MQIQDQVNRLYDLARQTGHYTRVNKAVGRTMQKTGLSAVYGNNDKMVMMTSSQARRLANAKTRAARNRILDAAANGTNG